MRKGVISSKAYNNNNNNHNNNLRKSSRRSNFVVQKNQSWMMMQQQQQARVEFPEVMFGEEMVHFSHPRHPLSRICLPDLFTCSGCKEYGAGNRFSCQQCDFQLHDFCALSPPALKAHPFHSHHHLLFYSKPTTTTPGNRKYCDVCANPIKGFSFRCGVCTTSSFQMHPCCAMLSTEINLPSLHPHPLGVLATSASASASTSTSPECGECKRMTNKRSGGRVYRCSVCEYHVHAGCAKNVKNGLRENGHKQKGGSEKGGSVLGTAARLASQVVVEFLGGIMEGIGEGVGEAFVQNINGKAAPSPLPPHHYRP